MGSRSHLQVGRCRDDIEEPLEEGDLGQGHDDHHQGVGDGPGVDHRQDGLQPRRVPGKLELKLREVF